MKIERNSNLRQYVAQTMKQYRKHKKITQDELAKLLEVNRTTVSKIENCKFSISIDYLELLSEKNEISCNIRTRRRLEKLN